MVLEVVGIVASGVMAYWSVVGVGISYLFSKDAISNKSTEQINSMKSFTDSSALKKALYVSHPGIYFAIGDEKRKRDRLDKDFRKRYGIKTLYEEKDM
jgi:hypothetical protein